MGYYKVNPQITNRVQNENKKIENYFGESIGTLSYIMNSLLMSNSTYGQVKKQIKSIINEIEVEKAVMNTLGTTLQEIMKQYEKTEQRIVENYTGKSVSNPSANNLDNRAEINLEESGTSDEKDPGTMTYEEYLEYRYENATDENTKKVYKKFLDNIKIKDDDYDGTAHYNNFWNHIKYNQEDDSTNVRGVGCTYYHEVGHLIDDQSDWFGQTSTDGSYDFYEKLNNDVNNYVNTIMEEKGYTDINDAYDDLSTWLNDDGNMKNGVSDLVNGLTDGEACGGWSHSDDYYNESSIAHEAFAHFFEAGMSADPTKLEYVKEIFPTAYEEFQKMLEDELD